MVNVDTFSFPDGDIDADRILTDKNLMVDELLCVICQGLLWKPKSCSSCQHLFCNNCIRTWLNVNPTCCPFRCVPFEEKRAPPFIQSVLGRLSIRCRNSSLGCTEILPYHLLEDHETIQCHFLTKQCSACNNYIRINEIDNHAILCIPTTVRCSMCKLHIDRSLIHEHLNECFQSRLNLLLEQIRMRYSNENRPTHDATTNFREGQTGNWFIQLYNHYQEFLIGTMNIFSNEIQRITQDGQQARLERIMVLWQLIRDDKWRIPFVLMCLIFFGFGAIAGLTISLGIFIQEQVNYSMYRTFTFIIIFSGLLCFGLPLFLSWISDSVIIVFTILILVIFSSSSFSLPLNILQFNYIPFVSSVLFIMAIFIFKMCLLAIRVFVWGIPAYVSAGCLAWLIIFVTFHMRD